jgi:inhibitor of KinA
VVALAPGTRRRVVSSDTVTIAPLGDRAVVVQLGDRIGDDAFRRVQAALHRLRGSHAAIVDLVPGYTSITVHYEPAAVPTRGDDLPHSAMTRALVEALRDLDRASPLEARVVEIPVCYDGALAPDLEHVANHASLTAETVVAVHSGATYTVQMIGFTPGFPYLAGLDPRLATPRRAEPRMRVTAGSVAIGGEQTGIYPLATPGGWNIIGSTPLSLFDAMRDPATLLRVGDRVRFVPIDRERYDALVRG